MEYILNSTKDYHIKGLSTLGWEMTVCNSLYPEKTILRRLLVSDESYGSLLYNYLAYLIPMDDIRIVVEIGGGYGCLMKDFLHKNSRLEPLMVDVSPYLLERQKEAMASYSVSYREEDFLETDPVFFENAELAIMNENLGDFPALVGIDRCVIDERQTDLEPNLEKMAYVFARYGLEPPATNPFNVNIGAIEAVEKLCSSGIPFIFLSEHSCEANVPESMSPYIRIESPGNPERISLMGHDEYSIKFSHLEKVAHAHGYRSTRGPMANFIRFDMTERVKTALLSKGNLSDEGELIFHFIEDLYKYEYLVLMKNDR